MTRVRIGLPIFWYYLLLSEPFQSIAEKNFAVRIPIVQHRRHLNFLPGSLAAEIARTTLLAPGPFQMLTVSDSSSFLKLYQFTSCASQANLRKGLPLMSL